MRVFVDTNLTSGESVMLLVPGSTTVGELKVGIGWEEAKYRGRDITTPRIGGGRGRGRR